MVDAEYTGNIGNLFRKLGIHAGDPIELDVDGRRFACVVLPAHGLADMVRLRMPDGYIIGIEWQRIKNVRKLEASSRQVATANQPVPPAPTGPDVVLLATGGTIAGRPDPVTGGLVAGRGASELYALVPELAGLARLKMIDLFSVLSENMQPAHWVRIARAVLEAIDSGARGVVVSHGTDTLHYTASALSFMIQNPPVPIVLVGSQKSIDRPSSDAALNLIHAVQVASTSDIAEVVVTMFGPTSDQYGIIHRGTRVRKMHTSARSTFRTIGDVPLGLVDHNGIRMLRTDYARVGQTPPVQPRIGVCDRAALLYYHPGMSPEVIDFYAASKFRGLVMAGTGMGHCSDDVINGLKRAVDQGLQVFMTSQTLWGTTNPYAYQTGRRLIDAGVTFLANMLPETALAKLYWALSQTKDPESVTALMTQNIANEIVPREPPDGYLVYQGGIPEVAEFLRKERL